MKLKYLLALLSLTPLLFLTQLVLLHNNGAVGPGATPPVIPRHPPFVYEPLRTRILLCTMVKNEAPYVVEWAVFHLQRGYEEIRFYVNDPSDNTTEVLREALGNVRKAGRADERAISVADWGGKKNQRNALRKCGEYADSNGFDWTAVHDVDEFHFSPLRPRTDGWLAGPSVPREVETVRVRQVRFGTDGIRNKTRWPDLVLTTHGRRAPSGPMGEEELKEELLDRFSRACNRSWDSWMCETSDSKSITRTHTGCVLHVHKPVFCRGKGKLSGVQGYEPDPREFRGNHYYLRSEEDAEEKSRLWKKKDPLLHIQTGADEFLSSVPDDAIRVYVPALYAAMEELRSDPTVNRTTGQPWLWKHQAELKRITARRNMMQSATELKGEWFRD